MKKPGGHCCAVQSCKNYRTKQSNISYFTVPKNTERANEWLAKCGRLDLLDKSSLELHKGYRICGAHFEDKMFANFQKNRLKPDAVPTLFRNISTEHDYSCAIVPGTSASTITTEVALPIETQLTTQAPSTSDFISTDHAKECAIQVPLSDGKHPYTPRSSTTPDRSCAFPTLTTSTVQTQTSQQLTSHSLRIEALRKSLKLVRQQNARLIKKNNALKQQIAHNIKNITLDEYMKLTHKFCPNKDLADFINSQVKKMCKTKRRRGGILVDTKDNV